jgi:chemotaxis protein MotB
MALNDNAEGKAKNRRIEIILTPKLDEISKMLNDLND